MTTVAEAEIQVGHSLGSMEYEIAPELVRDYTEAVDDRHEWYTGPSPFGGPVAPALLLHSAGYRFLGWYLSPVYGNLHARQEWELFAPVMAGDHLTARSTIVD